MSSRAGGAQAFTHWVNSVLGARGLKLNALDTDLRDGTLLANFLELLTRKKIQHTKRPAVKIQEIENLSICVNYIQKDVGVRLVGIGAEDLHEGNVKLILGLLWSLFRRFKIQTIETEDKSSEEGLLLWIKQQTEGYEGVSILNYADSFRDGLAFTALVDKYTDGEVAHSDYLDEEPNNRLQLAFQAMEQKLNVPQLLDPEEVATGFVDERALVLYLSLVFHAFKAAEEAEKIERHKAELAGRAKSQQDELARTQEEKDALELERAELSDKSALIAKELEDKDKSVEELTEANKAFKVEVEKFREQVSQQSAQLKKMKKWLKWERENLDEMRRLKHEREARDAALDALAKQLELHNGYLTQVRDRSYAAVPDTFDDEVKPRLVEQLKKASSHDAELALVSDLLDGEAVRVRTEHKSVMRIHQEAIADASKNAKAELKKSNSSKKSSKKEKTKSDDKKEKKSKK